MAVLPSLAFGSVFLAQRQAGVLCLLHLLQPGFTLWEGNFASFVSTVVMQGKTFIHICSMQVLFYLAGMR